MRFLFWSLFCFTMLCSFEANAVNVTTASREDKPLFNTDPNKKGPLTLEELDINLQMLNLNEKQQKCMMDSIAEMLVNLGDPENVNPKEHFFLENQDIDNWNKLLPYMKRVISAQAVISFAPMECY